MSFLIHLFESQSTINLLTQVLVRSYGNKPELRLIKAQLVEVRETSSELLWGLEITANTIDYRPLAIQANTMAVKPAGIGLLAGPYHPEFQKDNPNYQ